MAKRNHNAPVVSDDEQETINASPTKSFFVDMLTRDISVQAALLDLCDNALGRTFELAQADPSSYVIDGNSKKPLKPYFLHVTISSSVISIEDNCGGISVERARHDVFRLGREINHQAGAGLSVYGIGMKRAFFKLADQITLRSSTATDWFELVFKVSEWKKQGDEDWNLEFRRFGVNGRPANVPRKGTFIDLRTILPGVKTLIGSSTFENDLRERLKSTYSLFVALGLDLRLNNERIRDAMPALASRDLKPARKTLKLGNVDVTIIAGLSGRVGTVDPSMSGWFVYCNGRLVLEGEKSKITGWGDGIPQWHSKYNRFVGFVFFDSKDSASLPWTTTKSGLVDDAAVFIQARQEMKLQARPVLDFLNRLYPGEIPAEGVEERQMLESSKPLALNAVAKRDAAFVVPVRSKTKSASTVNVQYKKPTREIERVRAKLGKHLSASEIGSRTFDYFVKTECDD